MAILAACHRDVGAAYRWPAASHPSLRFLRAQPSRHASEREEEHRDTAAHRHAIRPSWPATQGRQRPRPRGVERSRRGGEELVPIRWLLRSLDLHQTLRPAFRFRPVQMCTGTGAVLRRPYAARTPPNIPRMSTSAADIGLSMWWSVSHLCISRAKRAGSNDMPGSSVGSSRPSGGLTTTNAAGPRQDRDIPPLQPAPRPAHLPC